MIQEPVEQMNLFENQLQSCPAGSREYRGGNYASRTALLESVKRLVMSVICGESLQESFASLGPGGSWVKMYRGCSQMSMDGFLDEYSGTWPAWGIMLDGECGALATLELSTGESEYLSLPTLLANDGRSYCQAEAIRLKNGIKRRASGVKISDSWSRQPILLDYYTSGTTNVLNPCLFEAMMGFQERWTELNASGMP